MCVDDCASLAIEGKHFDFVVCAALPAAKWIANEAQLSPAVRQFINPLCCLAWKVPEEDLKMVTTIFPSAECPSSPGSQQE